jgi:SAM-dependent methyltransferase
VVSNVTFDAAIGRWAVTMEVISAASPARLPDRVVRDIRRTRRHPRPWRSEYLHLRRLLDDLEAALKPLDGAVHDVVDVFCGARPYEDLLPRDARCVGLDVTDQYGVADVVTDEFLPFPDASFDLVLCTQAFQFVLDPPAAVREFERVLRPDGRVVVTVPHVWEYDRTALEHRFTGPSLAALFHGWRDIRVVENGERAVTWATVTGRMLGIARERIGGGRAASVPFWMAHLILNLAATIFDRVEGRFDRGPITLPVNLLLTARRGPT